MNTALWSSVIIRTSLYFARISLNFLPIGVDLYIGYTGGNPGYCFGSDIPHFLHQTGVYTAQSTF
jgi:hypothetical protein